MKVKILMRLSICLMLIAALLAPASTNLAAAVTMDTMLNPDTDHTNVSYEELHTVSVKYPADSELAHIFEAANERMTISSSTEDPDENNAAAMQNLVAKINKEFRSHGSLATVKTAKVKVTTEIKPSSDTQTVVSQQVILDFVMDGFVIPYDGDTSHKYVDFNWRAFTINQPIIIASKDNPTGMTRNVEVNIMSDIIDAAAPGFLEAVTKAGGNEQAAAFLQRPIIDFDKLDLSMDRWYVLFDPAASLQETERYGYVGEDNGAKVVTIYSLGEGSIREGKHEDTISTLSFGPNDAYSMEFRIPPGNARIDVLGYSNMHSNNGEDIAVISDKNEGGSSYAGNFPLVVLGSFGAIMAVIVGLVLYKAREPKLSR